MTTAAASEGKTSWDEYARHLRDLLGQMGIKPERCLPGEPDACGNTAAHHALGYLVQLQAKAEDAIAHMHHGDPYGKELAERLLTHWRTVFAAFPCDHEPRPNYSPET